MPLYHVEILNRHLKRRQKKNKAYTQSSFARDLGVSTSLFSRVLNEKRGFSKKISLSICEILKLDDTEQDLFISSIEAKFSKSPKNREHSSEKMSQRSQIDESFKYINDLSDLSVTCIESLTIFELCQFVHRFDNSKLANVLGISEEKLKELIELLIKFELIIQKEDGLYAKSTHLLSERDLSDARNKINQEAILEILDEIEMNDSDKITSMYTSIQAFDQSKKDEIALFFDNVSLDFYKKFGKVNSKNTSVGYLQLSLLNKVPKEDIV